jgi:hypothetical protein
MSIGESCKEAVNRSFRFETDSTFQEAWSFLEGQGIQ